MSSMRDATDSDSPSASGPGTSQNDRQDSPPWKVNGLPPNASGQGEGGPRRGFPRRRWWLWVVVLALLALNWVISDSLLSGQPPIHVPYTTFVTQLEAGNVKSVVTTGETIDGTFDTAVAEPDKPSVKGASFITQRPAFAQDDLLKELIDKGVVVNAEPPNKPAPVWEQLLFGFGPTLLLLWLFFIFYRRMAGGGGGVGGLGGLGRSGARRYEASGRRTTFDDVAGIDDAKGELVEVVDFLRNPGRYTRLGAITPRGVLLSGQPGTGKTLLARAVAGEADVPFFSVAASEFIEMIVGVGASRVRDLFNQAKQAAPAIIFIDEIDSIGRARGGAFSMGGHDEREQTLDQVLAEMDGFQGNEGVIVIAATNRPDVLDQALLRPGRFDRRVQVSPPDQTGRRAILEVHSRNVPLAADVDLDSVAASTPGMVGADLENLVNEAALTGARRGHERVTSADFSNALEKIVLGTERKIVLSPEERERTAYHESGHALLGMLQPGADPVRKISIIPRGRALGVTFQSPEIDRYSYTEDYLRGRIIGALGGRAAEELVYSRVTTGAENDLIHVTDLARRMVGRWGMSSEIGPLSVLSEEGLGVLPTGYPDSSPDTLTLVDTGARRIVEECYASALETLQANRERLDHLAKVLLERETLEEDEAYEIAGLPRTRPSTRQQPVPEPDTA
jgi:cell division protease FtsH